jgi:hypothetical protein
VHGHVLLSQVVNCQHSVWTNRKGSFMHELVNDVSKQATRRALVLPGTIIKPFERLTKLF